jgi:hypothetical protein
MGETVSLTVTFTGRVPLTGTGPDAPYSVWTYSVQPSSPTDLLGSQRIALAIPTDVDVQDPRRFPDVPALAGAFLEHDSSISRQYAGKTLSGPATSTQTISFVAPADQADREVFLVGGSTGHPWTVLPYAAAAGGPVNNVQTIPAPASSQRVFTGRPVADFTGTLPYASEIFGVYQPLVGWLGAQNTQRVGDRLARLADTPSRGMLSPVGLVDLFREYFFEFDTFLGTPVGHLWLSPGGTVEVIETSTRRTLTEQTAEQSEQVTRKSEEELTDQTDVADAVKEENANDTKLGASASAGASFAGIYHGDVSASYSNDTTTKKSSEQTHKHTRTQSSKVTSEITRNFKTTFKTVTEDTDTSSRRYVVQNTTDKLVNYELRRKMRKVGVQVQHLGSQLSWQMFLGAGTSGRDGKPAAAAPGRLLGIGEMVNVVPAPDVSSLHVPEQPPVLQQIHAEFTNIYNIQMFPIDNNNAPHNDAYWSRIDEATGRMGRGEANEYIVGNISVAAVAPAPGYTLHNDANLIKFVSAKNANGSATAFNAHYSIDDAENGKFTIKVDHVSFGGTGYVTLTHSLTWDPPADDPAQDAYVKAKAVYDAQVAELQRKAYGAAVRDRLDLLSKIRPRPAEDLREEERQAVFAGLVAQLQLFPDGPHLGAELIRQYFDVDQMLYFVAPDYWRPDYVSTPADGTSQGRYPVPHPVWIVNDTDPFADDPLAGETVVSWYSHNSAENAPATPPQPPPAPPGPGKEYRVNYLITENTRPAPMGSSLGWLIQSDADERRNQFLNAAWVKVVLPIQPGHEAEALAWLKSADVEGEDALDQQYVWQQGDPDDYHGLAIGQVLDKLAARLQAAHADIGNTLATEKVFENGFDPLDGGFRPANPYQVFDQWVEVLPTDQVVAVEVTYDPKTGQQL